jgi:hypothetical protein
MKILWKIKGRLKGIVDPNQSEMIAYNKENPNKSHVLGQARHKNKNNTSDRDLYHQIRNQGNWIEK